MEQVPKLRTRRDVGQECSCPPGKSLLLVALLRNIAPTGVISLWLEVFTKNPDIYLAKRTIRIELLNNLGLYTVSQANWYLSVGIIFQNCLRSCHFSFKMAQMCPW